MVSSPIYKLKKFLVPLADFQLNHFPSTTLQCFKAESLLDASECGKIFLDVLTISGNISNGQFFLKLFILLQIL